MAAPAGSHRAWVREQPLFGHSPATVRMLQQRLGLPTVAPRELGEPATLF